jgi:predicted DCC family thiol-disulfide oxidoreductase YuxK
MKRLNVIYDADCPLCRRCREWLQNQVAFIPLIFTPLQALDLEERFPGIGRYQPRKQLVVISDEGGIYCGAAAWIMCLYALEDCRELAVRLSHPRLMPLARRVCEMISQRRLTLSRVLHLAEKHELAGALPLEPPRRAQGCGEECEV